MGTLDASIPLGVRPMQLDNPLDVQAKQMTLRQLLRQGQIQEMEMEKAQQAQDQERTLADLYRNNINPDGTINRHGILQGAASQGAGSRIPGLQKGFADEDKAKSDLGHVGAQTARLTGQTATDDYALGRLKHDQGIRDILAMQSPDDARASLLRAVQNKEIDRDQGFQLHQQIPQDPGAFAQWKRSMLLRLMDAKAAYESTTPKFDKLDTNGSIDLGTIDPMTGIRTSNQVVPKVQSPDSVASNQRMAAEGVLNRGVQTRGQDLVSSRAAETNLAKNKETGKAPPGYVWGPADDRGVPTLIAAKGGPADLKLAGALNADTQALSGSNASMDRLAIAANEALNAPGLAGAYGLRGAIPNIPGSDAANATALLNTLKSQVGFGVLQDMRNNSKTGGALGAVSDKENTMLQANLAALEKAQSVEQARESLKKIIAYTEAAKGRLSAAYNMRHGDGSVNPGGPPTGDTPKPAGKPAPKAGAIDGGHVFMGGDPGDKKNWRKVSP